MNTYNTVLESTNSFSEIYYAHRNSNFYYILRGRFALAVLTNVVCGVGRLALGILTRPFNEFSSIRSWERARLHFSVTSLSFKGLFDPIAVIQQADLSHAYLLANKFFDPSFKISTFLNNFTDLSEQQQSSFFISLAPQLKNHSNIHSLNLLLEVKEKNQSNEWNAIIEICKRRIERRGSKVEFYEGKAFLIPENSRSLVYNNVFHIIPNNICVFTYRDNIYKFPLMFVNQYQEVFQSVCGYAKGNTSHIEDSLTVDFDLLTRLEKYDNSTNPIEDDFSKISEMVALANRFKLERIKKTAGSLLLKLKQIPQPQSIEISECLLDHLDTNFKPLVSDYSVSFFLKLIRDFDSDTLNSPITTKVLTNLIHHCRNVDDLFQLAAVPQKDFKEKIVKVLINPPADLIRNDTFRYLQLAKASKNPSLIARGLRLICKYQTLTQIELSALTSDEKFQLNTKLKASKLASLNFQWISWAARNSSEELATTILEFSMSLFCTQKLTQKTARTFLYSLFPRNKNSLIFIPEQKIKSIYRFINHINSFCVKPVLGCIFGKKAISLSFSKESRKLIEGDFVHPKFKKVKKVKTDLEIGTLLKQRIPPETLNESQRQCILKIDPYAFDSAALVHHIPEFERYFVEYQLWDKRNVLTSWINHVKDYLNLLNQAPRFYY